MEHQSIPTPPSSDLRVICLHKAARAAELGQMSQPKCNNARGYLYIASDIASAARYVGVFFVFVYTTRYVFVCVHTASLFYGGEPDSRAPRNKAVLPPPLLSPSRSYPVQERCYLEIRAKISLKSARTTARKARKVVTREQVRQYLFFFRFPCPAGFTARKSVFC